jgi:hypothetical protein
MALDKQSNPISSTKLSLLSERTYNSAEEIVSNLFREHTQKTKKMSNMDPTKLSEEGGYCCERRCLWVTGVNNNVNNHDEPRT